MCCVLFKCYANRVRCVLWLPVVGEIVLMLWTYYVYVVCLCYFTSDVIQETVALLVVYHALLALTLWAHCLSVTTRPRVPPQPFHYSEAQWSKLNTEFLWIERREEMESLRLRLGIRTIQASMGRGLLVYCQQCTLIKPDRCHHCSRCGVCVLKMDHHCPWINNCVGFHNYKYFLLFVFYCLAYCIFVPLTSLRFIIAFFVDLYNGVDVSGDYNRIQIILVFVFLIATAVALVPLLKLHWGLVSTNVTTLENTRPLGLVGKAPDMHLFDLGRAENLRQVFGHRPLLWLLPVFTSVGDGSHFPLRDDFMLERDGDFNKNKDSSLQDGVSGCNKNKDSSLQDGDSGCNKNRDSSLQDGDSGCNKNKDSSLQDGDSGCNKNKDSSLQDGDSGCNKNKDPSLQDGVSGCNKNKDSSLQDGVSGCNKNKDSSLQDGDSGCNKNRDSSLQDGDSGCNKNRDSSLQDGVSGCNKNKDSSLQDGDSGCNKNRDSSLQDGDSGCNKNKDSSLQDGDSGCNKNKDPSLQDGVSGCNKNKDSSLQDGDSGCNKNKDSSLQDGDSGCNKNRDSSLQDGVSGCNKNKDSSLQDGDSGCNKNKDSSLQDGDSGCNKNREETVMEGGCEDKKTDAALARDSADKNRTENSEYICPTRHCRRTPTKMADSVPVCNESRSTLSS
ncbi:hypothetical protein BsWGS_13335 [Bradybaena similaris]